MFVEKTTLVILLALAGLGGFAAVGLSMDTSIGGQVGAGARTAHGLEAPTPPNDPRVGTGDGRGVGGGNSGDAPPVGSRASAGLLSGIRAAMFPRVSFVRGVDGFAQEVASIHTSNFANKVSASGYAALRTDPDVLRWLEHTSKQRLLDNAAIEKVTFKREHVWFSPIVRRASEQELIVTVPARRADDATWLAQHIASGLARPHTRVTHAIPNNLFTKSETGNWITAGWVTGGVLGSAVGLVGGGPLGAALGGTVGGTGMMFAVPILRESLLAFPLEHRVSKLASSLRGKLNPGDTLTVRANGRTLDDLTVTVEPSSFPRRQASTDTVTFEGLSVTELQTELQQLRP